MKGKHRIILETERVKYDFTIKRNITIIQGDSATGKTTLAEYMSLYAINKEASGVRLRSDVHCLVFTGPQAYWKSTLEAIKGSIVLIDEEHSFVRSTEFSDIIQNSDNYYVLITREPLYNLPYSTKEIYGIRTSGKYHFPQQIYHEFYPIYEDQISSSATDDNILIVEDSGSGQDFFNNALKLTNCVSAKGNAKICSSVVQIDNERTITIIADGAAFGPYIEKLTTICRNRNNTGIYLPESFEWLILKSGVLRNSGIEMILLSPEDYIDSSVYFSWEQFFTELLLVITKNTKMSYSKNSLPEIFLTEHNKKKIIGVIPEEIRKALK